MTVEILFIIIVCVITVGYGYNISKLAHDGDLEFWNTTLGGVVILMLWVLVYLLLTN